MIGIGRIQELEVRAVDERGAWLGAGDELVLLPRAELPADLRPGRRLRVFVQQTEAGLPAATLRLPLAQVGEFALLRVSSVSRHGAFLEWGPEKELLVPFAEQPERLRVGRRYLVRVLLDRQGRTFASARIDKHLAPGPGDLAEGQAVELTVWEFTDLGAKVIVDDRYGALLFRDEIRGPLRRGDKLRGYVRQLREDGKIDVTLRQGGRAGVEEAKEVLRAALRQSGFLPLHDRSAPEEIERVLGMSKKTFKKALGGLYREGAVELTDEGVRLKRG